MIWSEEKVIERCPLCSPCPPTAEMITVIALLPLLPLVLLQMEAVEPVNMKRCSLGGEQNRGLILRIMVLLSLWCPEMWWM